MIRPHAFVAMPFGIKPGRTASPSTSTACTASTSRRRWRRRGSKSFRADQEMRAGDIRTDMFQELLVADLVVADLTHRQSQRLVRARRAPRAARARRRDRLRRADATTAFDLYTDRKLRYGLKDGGPDPATLEDDKRKLTEMVKATMESWHGRKVSPVYNLMPNLQEPDWKSLRIGDVREFWEQHDAWEDRVELARKGGRIGDVLVLAEEAPVAAFRADAWIKAGEALRKAERFEFALEHLERGLEIEPAESQRPAREGHLPAAAGLGGRAGSFAGSRARALPRGVEACTRPIRRLGRCSVAWTRTHGSRPGVSREGRRTQMRDDAAYEDALLRAAIDSYSNAYRANPGHYYSGINALTLMHLLVISPSDARYDRDMATMAGAVRLRGGMRARPESALLVEDDPRRSRGARRHA